MTRATREAPCPVEFPTGRTAPRMDAAAVRRASDDAGIGDVDVVEGP